MHLKGTKRSKPKEKEKTRHRRDTESRQKEQSEISKDAPEGNHFLELKKMVEMMQTNFLQEIASIKANLSSQPPAIPFSHQFNPSMMIHPSQASYQHNPLLPTTFIPQSLC